jgi:type I restriction enzyme S subunit
MTLIVPLIQIVSQSKNPLLKKHETWERVELCLIADVLNGFAFDSQKFSKDHGMPLIRIRDINGGQTECNYNGEFDPQCLVNFGDLLDGMDFNTSRWKGSTALLNQRVCKIIQKSKCYTPKFLDYVLPAYLQEINKNTSSLTVKHLSSQSIKEIPLPLPPLPEQHRIVTKIEELFTQLDAGVASLKKVQAQLKRYRQAVLKAAFEGRLTQEWREEHKEEIEPVDVIRERIERIWKTRPKSNFTQSLEEPDHVFTIPHNWAWIHLGSVTESMKNGIYKLPNFYSDKGFACLRMYNIENGKIVWKDIKRMTLSNDEIDDYLLKEGDFLVNRVNSRELVGKSAVIPDNLERCVYESKNIRLRFFKDIVHSKLVNYWFLHYSQKFFNKNAQQTVGMASINQNQLSIMPFPLSPYIEQLVMIEEIERHFSQIDHIENIITTSLRQAETLRQSILKQAFEGRLVPQDPNDEPASVLLERIKAEKACHAAGTKKGKTLQPKSPKRKVRDVN